MIDRTLTFTHNDETHTTEHTTGDYWWNIYQDDTPITSLQIETIADSGEPFDVEVIEQCVAKLEALADETQPVDDPYEVRLAA